MTSPAIPSDLKARVKASYDAMAHTYNATFKKDDSDSVRLGYLNQVLHELRSSGAETASVLELGCGEGIPGTRTLLETEKPQLHVTANDLSSAQISRARENLKGFGERLTLVEGDMMALSFPPSSLSAIIAFYSIIHLPREEQTQMMKKAAEWLKPGGLFLANFAAEEGESIVNDHWLGDKNWMYWSAWGEAKSVEMVKGAGFDVSLAEVRHVEGDAKFVWIIGKKV